MCMLATLGASQSPIGMHTYTETGGSTQTQSQLQTHTHEHTSSKDTRREAFCVSVSERDQRWLRGI